VPRRSATHDLYMTLAFRLRKETDGRKGGEKSKRKIADRSRRTGHLSNVTGDWQRLCRRWWTTIIIKMWLISCVV